MGLAGELSALATAAGTLVLLAGIARAALAPADAAATFARAVLLALEFLLAAGLLRLGESADGTTIAVAAAVIAIRTAISRSLKPIAGGGAGAPPLDAPARN